MKAADCTFSWCEFGIRFVLIKYRIYAPTRYVDFQEVGQDAPRAHTVTGTENLGIGFFRGSLFGEDTFRFKGEMRDLQVFKSALDPSMFTEGGRDATLAKLKAALPPAITVELATGKGAQPNECAGTGKGAQPKELSPGASIAAMSPAIKLELSTGKVAQPE